MKTSTLIQRHKRWRERRDTFQQVLFNSTFSPVCFDQKQNELRVEFRETCFLHVNTPMEIQAFSGCSASHCNSNCVHTHKLNNAGLKMELDCCSKSICRCQWEGDVSVGAVKHAGDINDIECLEHGEMRKHHMENSWNLKRWMQNRHIRCGSQTLILMSFFVHQSAFNVPVGTSAVNLFSLFRWSSPSSLRITTKSTSLSHSLTTSRRRELSWRRSSENWTRATFQHGKHAVKWRKLTERKRRSSPSWRGLRGSQRCSVGSGLPCWDWRRKTCSRKKHP